jgi:hypothetical protein
MKRFDGYIREQFGKRSSGDGRRRVDWYLVEFRDGDGVPYRKAYEFAPGTPFETVKAAIPQVIP